jgi:hypothetical protein
MKSLFRRLCAATLTALMLASLTGCGLKVRLDKIFSDGDEDEAYAESINPVGALSWAVGSGVTVTDNPEELAKQVTEMYESASEEGIGVEYKNEAFSEDGQNFDCYIGNPTSSHYPLFITIYADNTFQEELFVSGLIKPGQAFNKITFTRAITESPATLPVCYTQVYEPRTEKNDTDEFTIRGQAVITLNFNIVSDIESARASLAER